MKNYFILSLISLLFWIIPTANSQSKSVLFLGNSYTYYNESVPTVLKQVANSMGDAIEVESNSPGGYTFEGHSTNVTSLDLITSRNWDYVVLQEQSQMPSFAPEQVATEVYPFAAILCDSITSNSSCTIPIFFMTWGRENGDAANCGFYPPLCTYLGMSWRLRQSYVEMAETNNAWVSPVGMVWKAVRESNPEIDLYQADESHPTIAGTYLAACTFYATIFHKSPVGAYVNSGISAENAAVIQNAAWNVFADSLDTWRIDTTTVRVDFEPLFFTKSVTAYLANYSENADSCFWDFGDGTQQMQYPNWEENYDMMNHQYPEEAEYNICLTAYKGCTSVEICKIRYIYISENNEVESSTFSIFPNPVKDGVIYIENANNQSYKIIAVDGKIVNKGIIVKGEINVSDLKSGNYVLKIGNNIVKFVIL